LRACARVLHLHARVRAITLGGLSMPYSTFSHTPSDTVRHTHTLGGAHHRKCDATSRPLVENYNKQTILGAF
jgi:hypothetical protein